MHLSDKRLKSQNQKSNENRKKENNQQQYAIKNDRTITCYGRLTSFVPVI